MTRLYNQLFPQFLSNHSETVFAEILKMCTCFLIGKNIFDKITAFSNLENFWVMFNAGYQLLPKGLSNQSETLYSCCRHIEDVYLLS